MSVLSHLADVVSSRCPSYLNSFITALSAISQFVYSADNLYGVQKSLRGTQTLFMGTSLKIITVERSRFVIDLPEIVSGFKKGLAYQLVAGTGVGKSTIIPLTMATIMGAVGVVVVPDARIRDTVQKFVEMLAKSPGFAVNSVKRVCTASELVALVAPSVAFISATDLLTMLAHRNDLFSAISIGFVYIDECHEKIPQYFVLRYLQYGKWMKDTVVLYGSATDGYDMEGRGTDAIPQTKKEVSPDKLLFRSIGNLTVESPLSFSACSKRRTMVFLPKESDFPPVREYYENRSIQVFELTRSMNGDDIIVLYSELVKVDCFVLLTTELAQTAYTLPIDRCVDTGFSVRMLVDIGQRVVEIRDMPATRQEQTQRSGRVGRMVAGESYYSSIVGRDPDLVLPGSEIYVILWCIVLNVEINVEGNIKTLKESLGPIPFELAVILLSSVVHPYFLTPFVSPKLHVYTGLLSVIAAMTGVPRKAFQSVTLREDSLDDWPLQSTVIGDEELSFRTPWRVPQTMNGYFACMWYLMQRGQRGSYKTVSSVISTLSDARSIKSLRSESNISTRVKNWLKNDAELFAVPETDKVVPCTVGNCRQDVVEEDVEMVSDSAATERGTIAVVEESPLPVTPRRDRRRKSRTEYMASPSRSGYGDSPDSSPLRGYYGQSLDTPPRGSVKDSPKSDRQSYSSPTLRSYAGPLYTDLVASNRLRVTEPTEDMYQSEAYRDYLASLHEDVTTRSTRGLPVGEHMNEQNYEFKIVHPSELRVDDVRAIVPIGGGIQRAYQLERGNKKLHEKAASIAKYGMPDTFSIDPAPWVIACTMAWNVVIAEYSVASNRSIIGLTDRQKTYGRAQVIKTCLEIAHGHGFEYSYKPKIPTGLVPMRRM